MKKSFRRPQKGLKLRKTILIVTEGEKTEPDYFRGLRDKIKGITDFNIVVKSANRKCCQGVIDFAISVKDKDPYDEVWCVLDVENQENHKAIIKAISLADKNKINLCLSNPSFEIWFLAHFTRTSRSFLHADDVIEELNKHWKNELKSSYSKTSSDHHQKLQDKKLTAIKNAKEVYEKDHKNKQRHEKNSSTEVYQLIEKLSPPT
jgi:hypothetical protein